MEENLEMFVFLGLHTLGKEELLVTLARGLQTWVGVPRERYTTGCSVLVPRQPSWGRRSC